MARNRRIGRTATGAALVVMTQVLLVNPGSALAPASAAPAAASTVAKSHPCQRPAKGFVPTRASIPAIDRTVQVIQVKRTRSGAVGAGPVTEKGKWLMAMDPQTRPASRKGSVLLSGHTWPDGSALGNAMLRSLKTGHRVALLGKGGKRACYRITERTSYPVDEVPRNKAMRYWGREQLVIVACSGKRLGPGKWTHRTIWYGTPIIPASPPAPAPEPPAEPESPSLLGGLLGGLFG